MRDLPRYQRHAAPRSTALIDAETDERWTYAELDERVERTAGRIRSIGVEEGDQLGVHLEGTPAFVRLLHAAWRVGARFVPLNVRLSDAELRAQVDRVDLDALVHRGEAPAIGDARIRSVTARSLADEPVTEGSPADRSLDDPRAMLFTSGTTGEPKAVVLTARNLLASAVASAFRIGVLPDDRWYDPLPAYHMGGLAPIVRSALYGTTVVLGGEFDAERALAHLRSYGATGVSLVPTMLGRLLDAGDLPDSLRFVLTGGAPTSSQLIERCESRSVPIHPTYGMTETTSQVATARPEEAFSDPERVGRPLAFTRVRAVDGGQLLPPGETGELVVSGPTVSPGYYDPEATRAAFASEGYRTGDVGVIESDGSIRVIGRIDDAVITGGENVHPEEVAAVLRSHPDVDDATIVGLPDPEWGERVCALVVADALAVDELRAFCEGRLADHKRPKEIVLADALPRTTSGTVDREAVRERLRSERFDERPDR